MSTRRPPASTARGVTKLLRDGIKGEYSAGSSLYLSVNGEGAGSWIYRYMINGKRQRIGLGSVSEITLADANQRLAEQKQLVSQGKNPLEVRLEAAIEEKNTHSPLSRWLMITLRLSVHAGKVPSTLSNGLIR